MMLVLVWLISMFGFSILSLGMARHRKSLQLSPLTNKQEIYYLWVGLVVLIASLVLALISLSTADAILIWLGLLSIAALIISGYLSLKFEQKLPK